MGIWLLDLSNFGLCLNKTVRVIIIKIYDRDKFLSANTCRWYTVVQKNRVHLFFVVLSRSGLVLTFYLLVSKKCFIFLITNKIVTISVTVYNLFTNTMSKSTFTKQKILENLIA
jgi:hypothetical protein